MEVKLVKIISFKYIYIYIHMIMYLLLHCELCVVLWFCDSMWFVYSMYVLIISKELFGETETLLCGDYEYG